jgi:hypothetical protein
MRGYLLLRRSLPEWLATARAGLASARFANDPGGQARSRAGGSDTIAVRLIVLSWPAGFPSTMPDQVTLDCAPYQGRRLARFAQALSAARVAATAEPTPTLA